MTNFSPHWNVLPAICRILISPLLLLLTTPLYAQQPDWQLLTAAGMQALHDGHYDEATNRLQAALALANLLTPQDPRVATSLINLAAVFQARQQYAQAVPLLQRAIQLREQARGAEHPDVAEVLEAYVALLHKQHPWKSRLPWSEAAKLANRAERIHQRMKNPNAGASDEDESVDEWRWPENERELFDDSTA